jgi:hypothetical protein
MLTMPIMAFYGFERSTYQCLIGIAAKDRTLLVEMGNG